MLISFNYLLLLLILGSTFWAAVHAGITQLDKDVRVNDLQNLDIPQDLDPSVNRLYFANSATNNIKVDDFKRYPNLTVLQFNGMPDLTFVDGRAFDSLKHLLHLEFDGCPKLTNITGAITQRSPGIFIFKIINSGLVDLPKLYRTDPSIQYFDIVNFYNNRIAEIKPGWMNRLEIRQLNLGQNLLTKLSNKVFNDCHINRLILSYNSQLSELESEAFVGISELRYLDISNTIVQLLPEFGLKSLRKLVVQRVFSMKELPPLEGFTSLKEAILTYPYHCCMFKNAHPVHDIFTSIYQPKVIPNLCTTIKQKAFNFFKAHKRFQRAAVPSFYGNREPIPFRFLNLTGRRPSATANSATVSTRLTHSGPGRKHARSSTPATIEEREIIVCQNKNSNSPSSSFQTKIYEKLQKVKCSPKPDHLNPCSDIMENIGLRCLVWFVWLFAVAGNTAVLVVVGLKWYKDEHMHRREMQVQYLAILNLAVGDLIVGTYLGMLALKDVQSQSDYYNSAVDWQTGWGCNVAGFLAVLGSEVSLFSMFVVSLDRFELLRLASRGTRLKFSVVLALMKLGWASGLTLAVLPLLSVNSYGHTALCLPLRDDLIHLGDRAYLGFLLVYNLILFMAITGLYVASFLVKKQAPIKDRDPHDINSAKYFATLIITNMMCWVPTIFFGLTAMGGVALITISTAKYLLVIFFPINSMLDPFIYAAISTVLSKYVERPKSLLRRRWSSFYTSEGTMSGQTWHSSASNISHGCRKPSCSSNNVGKSRLSLRTESESSVLLIQKKISNQQLPSYKINNV